MSNHHKEQEHTQGHDHTHGEACGCGHDYHDHDHESKNEKHEGCNCGHDHHGHHHTKEPETQDGGKVTEGHEARVYTIENLGCANCAAKMEKRISALPEVSSASITFATKELRLTAANQDRLLPEIEAICQKIENGVHLVAKEGGRKKEIQRSKRFFTKDRLNLISLILGGIFFIGVEIYHEISGIETYSMPLIIAFVVAYLVLGGNIVLTAVKNLFKGQVFDENFLMSVATLGAFAIAQYPEAVGVMLFFRIGITFEHYAVERSRSQIMEAVDLRPETVNLLVGESVKIIGAEEAQVGDILLVRPGDRIPLDGIVIDGESRIDTAAITGEPVPVGVSTGYEVISGCVNTSGALKIRVEKGLEESMVTRILDSVENAAASKPRIDNFITRFARVYTPVVVVIALFTAVGIPLITGQAFYPWIYTALSFLVMSCPCALVLSVPLAFFCGIGAGSKKGILFKGGVVMEVLANIKAVVMDKTGTITQGNFVVQQVIPTGNFGETELLALAASCEQVSTHPIATSIVAAAEARGLTLNAPEAVEELSGKGIVATQGDRTVLCGNVKLMEFKGIDLAGRVKAQRGSEVLLAVDGVYAGQIIVADTLKPEARSAISRIKDNHILTAMLTGDAQDSADAVAAEAGVEEVHARLLPQDKLAELGRIRDKIGSVMFVGDGINDAPVLAGADVGAAMGSGADAAIEAADVVFMNSNLDAIPAAIEIAKKTLGISWQNVVFALTIKIIVMILGLTGIYANMWLAVFADTGVAFLCILNSIRILYSK